MLQYLESKLYADVEGTCSGQFGYIIAVVSILDIGKGMVVSGSGQAEFVTRYRAIVFKPFKGEVVDGVVKDVSKVCWNIWPWGIPTYGMLDGFLCRCRTTTGLCVSTSSFRNGIGSSALTKLISSQLIHPDMRYDPTSNPPSFASEDQVCFCSPSTKFTSQLTPSDHRKRH